MLVTSAGVYAQNEIEWTPWFRTSAGLRTDASAFRVDALNPLNSGTTSAGIVSPKGGATLGPWKGTEFYVNAGTGFHSNNARGTTITRDGWRANRSWPRDAARAREGRGSGRPHGRDSAPSDHRVALDAAAGIRARVQRRRRRHGARARRASQRYGVEFANYYSAAASGSRSTATSRWSRARFTEFDPAGDSTCPKPSAPWSRRARAWTAFHRVFGSVRLRYFGPRALVEDNSVRSKATSLVNLQGGYQLVKNVRVTADVFNLFNAQVSDIDYYFSRRACRASRSRVSTTFTSIRPSVLFFDLELLDDHAARAPRRVRRQGVPDRRGGGAVRSAHRAAQQPRHARAVGRRRRRQRLQRVLVGPRRARRAGQRPHPHVAHRRSAGRPDPGADARTASGGRPRAPRRGASIRPTARGSIARRALPAVQRRAADAVRSLQQLRPDPSDRRPRGDPQRDDPRRARGAARRPSAPARRRSAGCSATRAAAGTATRWSSRRPTSRTRPTCGGSGERLRLVERFTRADAKTLLYEFTVDDPASFVKPWTAVLPMTRPTIRIYEYACHEGNYAMTGILRGARATRTEVTAGAAEARRDKRLALRAWRFSGGCLPYGTRSSVRRRVSARCPRGSSRRRAEQQHAVLEPEEALLLRADVVRPPRGIDLQRHAALRLVDRARSRVRDVGAEQHRLHLLGRAPCPARTTACRST